MLASLVLTESPQLASTRGEVACLTSPSPPIQAHLPQHAQAIYLSAFNNAWTEYAAHGPAQREEIAHCVAWAAVKRKYRKAGDRWIPRDE
jgi:cation transport regulator